MLIIPEQRTVVILTPRTGSGTLKRTIQKAYPQTIALYRHMEADGVPAGYDHWRRLAVYREPVGRLWSLYKFLENFGEGESWSPEYIARQALSQEIG